MATPERPDDPVRLAAHGIDPNSILIREPRVMLDSRFIASLYTELETEFGQEEATITLLQIGFLHGMRGAMQVLDDAFDASHALEVSAAAPLLATRFQTLPVRAASGSGEAGLEIHGCWPDRHEAEAQLLRERDDTGCILSAGYTSGWLSAMFDADILALEACCSASGAEGCYFVAREEDQWRARGDEQALALLDALPFEAFRGLIDSRISEPGPAAPEATGTFDPEAAAVHIWGPVMVIPFCGGDDALRAMELITRDPGAAEVSVLVVDLTNAIVDEGFGAAALEQVVETADALGAETIFAGASSLCEPVIAGLERQPLLVRKDVHEAISAAFQIARAQRTFS